MPNRDRGRYKSDEFCEDPQKEGEAVGSTDAKRVDVAVAQWEQAVAVIKNDILEVTGEHTKALMIPHIYTERDQGTGYYKKEYEGALNDTDVKEKAREYVQNEVETFYKESVGEWFEKQVAVAESLEPEDMAKREDALKDITDAFKQGFNQCRATADSFHFAGLRDVSDEKRARAYKLAEAHSFGRMLTYCLESIADIQKGVSPHLLPAQIDLLSVAKLIQDGNQDFIYKPKDQLAHGRRDILKGLETLDTSFHTNDILLYGDSTTGATAYTYQTQSPEISKRKERALSNSRYAVVQGLLPFLNRLRMSLHAVKALDTDYSHFGRGDELSFIDKEMEGYGFRSPGARDKKKDEFAPYKKQGETFQELQASQKLYDEYNKAFKNRLADQSPIHSLIDDKMKATREKEEQDGLRRKQEQEQKEEQGKFIEKWTGVYKKKLAGYKAQYESEYKDAISKKGLFGARNVEKQKAKWTKERDSQLKILESQVTALGMNPEESVHDFLTRSYKTFQQPVNQKKLESAIDTAAKRDALANFSGDIFI